MSPTGTISRCGGTATGGTLAEVIVGDASLWAFYRLEEPSGAVAGDSGPFGLHLTKGGGGTLTWAQGAPSFAVQSAWFAPDAYVARASGFTGLAAGDMTAEIWFYKLDGQHTFMIGANNPIGASNGWALSVQQTPSSTPLLWVGNGVSTGQILGTTHLPLTTWGYIAAVRNSGTWTLYVNGTPEGTPITTVPTNEPDLWIGATPLNLVFDSNTRYSFAAVYDRALSATEIAAHYALA